VSEVTCFVSSGT